MWGPVKWAWGDDWDQSLGYHDMELQTLGHLS